MSTTVTVVDYGIGNVYSVCQALRAVGCAPRLTADHQEIMAASHLILPGVGAFAHGMQRLRQTGLDVVVKDFCAQGRPFLGVCLGMQMLLENSEEQGQHEGLGLIPGSVVRIADKTADGSPHKVPHIAWAALSVPAAQTAQAWSDSPLAPVRPGGDTYYFVHSYAAVPAQPQHNFAEAAYDGYVFSAVVRRDNIMGMQFHPERSGPAGLRVLQQFAVGQSRRAA